MASDYAAIRADNERRYGTDIGEYGPTLLADRYGDRTHFIFELLQNAEDALARRAAWTGSRRVKFELSANGLRVSHFGAPFNTNDVRGICGIAKSTKSLTAIGRFGIGFKSVYAFTERPEVHSGGEDFAIENFVWPTATSSIDRKPDETVFLLPPKANDPSGHEEIARGLERLGPSTLLFLRQIEEIAWSVDGGASGFYLRSAPETPGDGVRRLTLIGQEEGKAEIEEHWLIFSQEVTGPDGLSAGPVEIAFSLARGKDSSAPSIQPVNDSPLVVFFPTVLLTHLGFLVQGPYRTTPSRDNVPRNDPWNQRLVQETAQLLVRALRWLRDHEVLDAAALCCLPIDRSRLGEGARFSPLFEATRDALRAEALLPRFGTGHVPAGAARLARTQELRTLFDGRQLARLHGVDGELAWLSADITQDRSPQLRQYLMQELDIAEITPAAILPRLDKAFLEEQTDEWIGRLYQFLNGQAGLLGLLEKVPLVRLADGTHVTAHRNGQPCAFLPGAAETSFPTVRREVCSTGDARKFLQSLGLTEPDLVDDVVHNVLPKYRGSDVDVSDPLYDADIRRIVTAFATDSKAQREKLLSALRETSFVMAVDAGDGSKRVSKPGDVYLATDRLKALFAGVADVLLVDDSYACLRGDDVRSLLEACGAARCLDPVRVVPSFTWEERQEMRTAAGCAAGFRDESFEDYAVRGLDNLFMTLAALDAGARAARASLLWDALREMEERRGSGLFTGKYRWWYYQRNWTAPFDAAFVKLLNTAAWVPASSGELERPEFVLFDQLGWKADAFLLSKIRFKPPIIEALAREAGIDPRVLDLLKKHGITSEAELLARLGVAGAPEESDSDEPKGDVPGDAEVEPEHAAETAAAGGSSASSQGAKPGPPSEPSQADRDGHAGGAGGQPRPGGGADSGSRTLGSDGHRGHSDSHGDGEKGRKQAPGGGGARSFVSYVAAHPDDEEPDPDGLDHEARMALEESAIALILEAEPHLRRTPTHNPGYDLHEDGPEDNPVRWIEVKAMKGELRDRPVGLSRTQFECAREHGDAYWLYVVEHAGDEGRSRILRIQDPAGKARTFTFDQCWIAVAESADIPSAEVPADEGEGRAPPKERVA